MTSFQAPEPGSPELKRRLTQRQLTMMTMGGAISGEHGIGTEKKAYVAELEDPVKLALMRRIKTAFDPRVILNPGTIFDPSEDTL